MSVKTTKPNNRELAARAIARLHSGALSPQDVRQIGEWQTADAAYKQEFLRTDHLLADMERLQDSANIQAILNEPDGAEQRMNGDRSRPGIWFRLAVAAGLLLVIAVSYQVFIDPLIRSNTAADGNVLRYVTRIGEQKNVELSDGSIITLNTGSELLVNLTDQARSVTLVRGEVFFDIAHDPQRPFSVDVDTRRVSVLGTQFNIHKQPEQFTLSIVEGLVSLHRISKPVDSSAPKIHAEQGDTVHIDRPAQYRFSAGWVAEFNAEENTLTAYASPDMEGMHRWRTGLIAFSGEPFYKVVQELNRYSRKKILIEDSGLMDIKVYASVRVDDINAALASLERVYSIKLINYFDHIGVVSAKKNRKP